MIRTDFETAKLYLSQVPDSGPLAFRKYILRFYQRYAELTEETLYAYYDSLREAHDPDRITAATALRAFAVTMGLPIPPSQQMTEDVEANKKAKSERDAPLIREREANRAAAERVALVVKAIMYSIGGVIVLSIVAIVVIVAADFSDASKRPSLDRQLQAQGVVLLGHTAVVKEAFLCAGTSAAEQEVVKAFQTGDKTGIVDAVASSGGFELKRGSRVRAIDTDGLFDSLTRFRVESGPRLGSSCWLPTDIEIFSNIQ